MWDYFRSNAQYPGKTVAHAHGAFPPIKKKNVLMERASTNSRDTHVCVTQKPRLRAPDAFRVAMDNARSA